MSKRQLKKRIIGTRMPHLLASTYEKAARMVIDTYYIPTAEEIIAELYQMRTNSIGTLQKVFN